MDRSVEENLERNNAMLRALSVAAGAIAAVATASTTVWRKFYDEMKTAPGIKELRETHAKSLGDLKIRVEAEKIPYSGYIKDLVQQKRDYSINVNKEFAKIGIESEGFLGRIRGTWQRFETMGPLSKQTVVFNAAVGLVVTMGGALALANQYHLNQKMNQIADKSDNASGR